MAQHAMRWSAPIAFAVFPIVSLVAAWVAVRAGGAVRAMAIVLGLLLASYYVVYVTTPFDITWHVTTSVDRLLVQLWPGLVLTVFLGLQSTVLGPQSTVSLRSKLKTHNEILSNSRYFRLLIAMAIRSYSLAKIERKSWPTPLLPSSNPPFAPASSIAR
jgi:hypothetical protein